MLKVKISQIKPNPKNPRIIKDDKFQKLVKSIQEFPEMLDKRPLICFTDVDGKYVILGGNMRYKACIAAGLKEVPIDLADDWTEEQKRQFVVKDNLGYGDWDFDALSTDYDIGELEEWGLDVPGMEDYSEKNEEIDVNDFEDEMVLKLKFNKDSFIDIQERLNIAKDRFKVDSNEDCLKELLSFHERTK